MGGLRHVRERVHADCRRVRPVVHATVTDVGRTLRALETAHGAGGDSTPAASAPTAAVAAAASTSLPPPSSGASQPPATSGPSGGSQPPPTSGLNVGALRAALLAALGVHGKQASRSQVLRNGGYTLTFRAPAAAAHAVLAPGREGTRRETGAHRHGLADVLGGGVGEADAGADGSRPAPA